MARALPPCLLYPAQGVRKAFEDAVNSDRRLLVYENARHNVGGNPPPPEALGSFAARAFFDEPVWRKTASRPSTNISSPRFSISA